ncbi:hypothetical protein PTTG_00726 [Puccinia triticina 1-1 BBBD Race 1]|uniref:Uncharacterized protein n=1 Tax=Puccinia triticina (isolate 1-1 / race 1 (BBBD)) TaxID=630390 RepID=A0A180GCQ6_PUCT1|nr:hypothetical protein PTTG_00726 [Puccinia triticina 1-1 BBBD Race 1]
MSTRRTTSSNKLFPFTDPEEILRRARAEQRRLQQAALTARRTETTPTSYHLDPTEPSETLPNPDPPLVVGSAPASLPSPLHDSLLTRNHIGASEPTPLTISPSEHPLPPEAHPRPPSPTRAALMDGSSLAPGSAGDEKQPTPMDHTGLPNAGSTATPAGSSAPAPSLTTSNLSTKDYMKMMMAAQQASIVQAQAERAEYTARLARSDEVNEGRMGRLKEAFINLLNRPSQQPSGQVDLWKVNTTDAPKYTGPYMEIESFLVWINGVEIFFTSKEITEDRHKTLLIGRLISETNLLSFYQSAAPRLLTLSWTEVKDELFDTALLSDWTRVLR